MNSNSTNSTEDLEQVRYILYTGADLIHIIVGLPLNVYVLWLMVTGERGTMISNCFALNLAISEILTCLSSLMFILNDNIYSPKRKSGPLWKTGVFFEGFILAGRPLFQSCICLERYLAVVQPVTFLKYKRLRYRIGCCAVVWLLLLVYCIANVCQEKPYALNYINLCLILVTCSIKLFCCLAVLRVLKRPKPGDVEADGEGTNNMKLRAFRIILVIIVSMMVMYLPLTILMIMYHLIDIVKFRFGMIICLSFLIVTGFVQPLLYLERAGKPACIRGS